MKKFRHIFSKIIGKGIISFFDFISHNLFKNKEYSPGIIERIIKERLKGFSNYAAPYK